MGNQRVDSIDGVLTWVYGRVAVRRSELIVAFVEPVNHALDSVRIIIFQINYAGCSFLGSVMISNGYRPRGINEVLYFETPFTRLLQEFGTRANHDSMDLPRKIAACESQIATSVVYLSSKSWR